VGTARCAPCVAKIEIERGINMKEQKLEIKKRDEKEELRWG